jgi:hypothetical protein
MVAQGKTIGTMDGSPVQTHKKGEEQAGQLILSKRATTCHDPAMDEDPIEMNEG